MEHSRLKHFTNSLSAKIASVAIITAILTSTFSIFFVRKAEATLPVIEAEKTQQILNTVKEWGLDGLIYSLAAFAGQKLSTVIVNKITGGGSGDKPSQVIQDFGQILMNTKTQQGEILVNQLAKKAADEASAEFSPYAKDFALKLSGSASQSVEEIGKGIAANIPNFEIKNMLGDQWKDFEKDITVGGWNGLLALGNPSNNPIGFNIQTGEELARRINARTEELKVKLGSTGVQPSKGKCQDPFKLDDNLADIGEKPPETFIFQATDNDSDIQKNADGKTYDEAYKQWTDDTMAYQDKKALSMAGGLVKNMAPCLMESISNPIGTVQSLANSALSAGQETLAQSDEIGEVVGAIILSFVKGALNGGLSAVQADLAQQKTRPVGGPEQASSDPSKWNRTPARIVDMKTELGTAVINTGRELYYLEKALTEYDKYPQNIYALNQCVPGPKIGWYQRLDKLFKSATKKLERKTQAKNDKTANKAQDILDNVTVSMTTAQKETQLVLLRPSLNIPGYSGMQGEVDKFGDTSLQRKNIYKALLDRRAAQSQLSGIMDDIKGSMTGLYPQTFKPVLTRIEWESLTPAEKDTNASVAMSKTSQTLTIEYLDQSLLPDDLIPVYYTTASSRPDSVPSESRAWDELTEAEQERAWQAAEIDYLEIRNPGGEAISQCTDGIDNDGDGKIDNFDLQCSAPYITDNNEAAIEASLTNTQKRDRVMALTKSLTQYSVVSFYQWDRWNNGESIVLPENVVSFKKQKDSIRQRYARLDELLGNASTIGKAQQSYEIGLSQNTKVMSFLKDCYTLKTLLYSGAAGQGQQAVAVQNFTAPLDKLLPPIGGLTSFLNSSPGLYDFAFGMTSDEFTERRNTLSASFLTLGGNLETLGTQVSNLNTSTASLGVSIKSLGGSLKALGTSLSAIATSTQYLSPRVLDLSVELNKVNTDIKELSLLLSDPTPAIGKAVQLLSNSQIALLNTQIQTLNAKVPTVATTGDAKAGLSRINKIENLISVIKPLQAQTRALLIWVNSIKLNDTKVADGNMQGFLETNLDINSIAQYQNALLITSSKYAQICPKLAGKDVRERNRSSATYIPGPDIKECLLALMNNPQSGISFQTQEVRNSITEGGSILDRDCKNSASTDCNAGISSATSYVQVGTDDDGNETETVFNISPGTEINQTTRSPYQVLTQFDIQGAFAQDEQGNLFCKFDQHMEDYRNELKPVIKVGKPMTCKDDTDGNEAASKDQWYNLSRGELMILYYPKNLDY